MISQGNECGRARKRSERRRGVGKDAARAAMRLLNARQARRNDLPLTPNVLACTRRLTLNSPLVKPGIPSFQTFSSPMGHFSFPLASVSGVKPGNHEHRQHLPHSNAIATGCAHQLVYGRADASWP